MENTILQVPMSKSLKAAAKKAALDQGFSSLQEAVRVLLHQLSKQRLSLVATSTEPPEYLTPEQEAVLDKELKQTLKDLQQGKAYTFDNTKDLINFFKSL